MTVDPQVFLDKFLKELFFCFYLEESGEICVLLSPIFLGVFFFLTAQLETSFLQVCWLETSGKVPVYDFVTSRRSAMVRNVAPADVVPWMVCLKLRLSFHPD